MKQVRFVTWNVDTLTGKSTELIDVLTRQKVSITCMQETTRKGAKAWENGAEYKQIFSWSSIRKNGIGGVLGRDWKDKMVEVITKKD